MVDLVLLGHVEPGAVAEGALEQGQQRALKHDVEDLLAGPPVFAGHEVAADVHQVLDLLVSCLLVL